MKNFCVAATLLIPNVMAFPKSTGMGQELIRGFNVAVTYNAWSQVATFRVVIPNNTWFGLVLGSQNHKNSDMI
jgi:hypothetical protein